ncbi:MAG: hypothetical protein AABX72_01690 [Nanoarchaeota archaeon]
MNSTLSSKAWLFLVIGILLISGCQGFGKQQQPQQTNAFVGGMKGMDVAFAEGQPPASVLDKGQEEFTLTLLMRNLGEYTIPVGGVIGSLSGVVQNSFSLKSLDVKSTVEVFGVTKDGTTVIPGGEEMLEFGTAQFKPDLPADTKFTFKADVCYTYQTQSVSTVCLKKNVLRKEVGEVCQINNPTLGQENSGAPMHVEQMKESSVGNNKVRLNFKVVNKGIGQVYEPGTFTTKCTGMESEKNRVKITVGSSDSTFTSSCTQLGGGNSGVVTLVNNQKDITCTIDTTNLQDITFQDLVLVKLDYQYREAVTTPLVVTNAA